MALDWQDFKIQDFQDLQDLLDFQDFQDLEFLRLAGPWVHSFSSCYAGRDIGLLSSQSCRMALDWQDFKIFWPFLLESA